MTMMSEFNRSRWRNVLLALAAAVVTAGTALPQSTNVAKPIDEGEYSTWDIGVFFGPQWFQIYQETANQLHLLLARPIVGVRAGQDMGKYFGMEGSFGTGFNRLALLPYGGSGYASVSERNYQFAIHGLLYMTPRTSKYRPFLDFGPTGVVYQPGQASSLQQPTTGILAIPPAAFRTKTMPGVDYGIGIKLPLSHKLEARLDLMGLWTPTPDFGLPNAPSGLGALWITTHRGTNGLRFTTEIGWKGGFHEPAPAHQTKRVTVDGVPPSVQVSAIRGGADVCPGDASPQFSVTATGAPANGTLSYQWFVNNAPAPGATGPTFNMPTTNGSGNKDVKVTVTLAWPESSTEKSAETDANTTTVTTTVIRAGNTSATSNTVSVRVKTLAPPTVQFAVSPSTINYGDRLPLNATATVSECATATPIRYTASEGTIAGNTFDSSGVSFDPNNTNAQSKVVRLTATETDSKNQTASANATVTVNKKAVASRQDIVFANRSSRVNNAAKRYLIEQLTPRLRADPGSAVILVGHRDTSETGRAFANLDTQRVLNTAAVLSAGKGVCPSLDLSRVQVNSAGTDQTNPPMPFGDASVKERSGQSATDQRAQFRRVEVWFVPSGADKPAISGLQPAPEKAIKAKGCPK